MDQDNTCKLSKKKDQLQRTLLKFTSDELSAWNQMKDDFLLENKVIIRQRDYEKPLPSKSISRNVSPYRHTKNKSQMRSNLIPISFSSNPKEFEQQRMPKIARYWQRRFTISKGRAFGKSADLKMMKGETEVIHLYSHFYHKLMFARQLSLKDFKFY